MPTMSFWTAPRHPTAFVEFHHVRPKRRALPPNKPRQTNHRHSSRGTFLSQLVMHFATTAAATHTAGKQKAPAAAHPQDQQQDQHHLMGCRENLQETPPYLMVIMVSVGPDNPLRICWRKLKNPGDIVDIRKSNITGSEIPDVGLFT